MINNYNENKKNLENSRRISKDAINSYSIID